MVQLRAGECLLFAMALAMGQVAVLGEFSSLLQHTTEVTQAGGDAKVDVHNLLLPLPLKYSSLLEEISKNGITSPYLEKVRAVLSEDVEHHRVLKQERLKHGKSLGHVFPKNTSLHLRIRDGVGEDQFSLIQPVLAQKYSTEGQDQWVLDAIGKQDPLRKPVFLDIGARDGDFFSNTRKLEEHGWTGTCIEPFPSNFQEYHRTCNLVQKALVAKKSSSLMFSNCEDGSGITGWSGFTKFNRHGSMGCTQTEVPQTTFAELNLPSVIDYISLDVEGAEMMILESFPFDTHCAKLWTVEEAGTACPSEWARPITSLLESKGCKLVLQSESDGFFKCECPT